MRTFLEVDIGVTIAFVSPGRYWAARMAAEAAAAEQQRQMLAEADAAEAEVIPLLPGNSEVVSAPDGCLIDVLRPRNPVR